MDSRRMKNISVYSVRVRRYYLRRTKTAMNTGTTLLIPEKADPEFEQVFTAVVANGNNIRRLGKYWIKDEEIAKSKIAIYGNQAFALVLSQLYNVTLVSPDDSIITRLKNDWVKRSIVLTEICRLSEVKFPAFIKPLIPKMFIAGVFQSAEDFYNTVGRMELSEAILVSDVIADIKAEARCFVLNGIVMDIALYEGKISLTDGNYFAQEFVTANRDSLPATFVLDIAYSNTKGWFVMEFNACWAAGLNNCSATKVIGCIFAATINSD